MIEDLVKTENHQAKKLYKEVKVVQDRDWETWTIQAMPTNL